MSLVGDLLNGCTIWTYIDMWCVRKLKALYPDWIEIVEDIHEIEKITGRKFAKFHSPYLLAWLTDEGREHMEELRKGMKWC